MDTGNIIAFLKKWILIAIVEGIFNLEINELPNFNLYIFGIALAYTILWMFNKSYSEEE